MFSAELIVFSFLTVIIVVPTIAHYWSQLRIKEWEMSLKHAMIERGMSATEIEHILKATSSGKVDDELADAAAELRRQA